VDNVVPRHKAAVNLPKRHRLPGGELLPGGLADRFNLCFGPPLAFYLFAN
jgi:hypothetical protein